VTTDPALLPPDPSVPGRYWMTRTGWNIGRRVEIWEWSPSEPLWRHEQWGPMSPDLAGKAGYTLCVPYRILKPGELEAVHRLTDEAAPPLHPAGTYARGYTDGMAFMARMLRAALETKETT